MEAIIQDAIEKQMALLSGEHAVEWRNVLIRKDSDGFAPPIVWFGNADSKKLKIITIGVNPSNKEFYDNTGNLLQESRIDLSYDIKKLARSYNNYFEHNPYTKWFGKKDGEWAVEGLINALHASFYNNDKYDYQAIHIDLFPFATLQKFKSKGDVSVFDLAKIDLFATKWTYNCVSELIKKIAPKIILIFGRTNIECFETFVKKVAANYGSITISNGKEIKYRKGVLNLNGMQIPIVLIYAYLSNERGFTKDDLRTLKKYLTEII